jgi:hypothetical protein
MFNEQSLPLPRQSGGTLAARTVFETLEKNY